MAEIIFHIGMVKTATSSLQQSVFPYLKDMNYLGQPYQNASIQAACTALCNTDRTAWDAAAIQNTLLPTLSEDRPNLISYENYASYKAKDKGQVADRIKELFPNAKILITLRRQPDMVTSWYLQKMKPKTLQWQSFDRWMTHQLRNPHNSILDDLNFDALITYYESLFGKENIGLFLYEELRKEPQRFAQKLGDFLGTGAEDIEAGFKRKHFNPSLTARHIAHAQIASYIIPKAVYHGGRRIIPKAIAARYEQWLAAGARPAISISPDHQEKIHQLCAEGNRHLQEHYNLPLKQYNYPL